MDWPVWITLGGMSMRTCAGSDWLAGVTAGLCAVVVLLYAAITRHWLRSARRTTDPRARRALVELAVIFMFCGLAGYGLRVVMLFVPAWSLLLLTLGGVIVACLSYLRSIRGLAAVFERSEAAARALHGVEAVALRHDLTPPARDALVQLCRELDALTRGDDG